MINEPDSTKKFFLTDLEVGIAAVFETTDSSSTPDSTGESEVAGAVIGGKYELKEIIGEGGMGIVWLAEQQLPVQRIVVVKLIKPGVHAGTVDARFAMEIRALALMDHPNIAKVLDGGVSGTGRPYFVMELVKGISITHFCDRRMLNVRDRLKLFLQVCKAIQHAHQKGIIHRDVKPSNVIVTLYDQRPVPKVIDFGVAEAMESVSFEGPEMEPRAVVGTPQYMSPEQTSPDNFDVDTRSDIYSLGILLYELLTGKTPFGDQLTNNSSLAETLQMIRETAAPLPSSKVSFSAHAQAIASDRDTTPVALLNSLRTELDWVVMKAISKDRKNRFQSVHSLACEVERFINDEALESCPPSARYRVLKLAGKHRAALLTSVLFLALILTASVVSGWLAFRATRSSELASKLRIQSESALRIAEIERDDAIKARVRTREVLDAMTSGLTENVLSQQNALSADQKKFLNQVLDYYNDYAALEGVPDELERTAHACQRVARIQDRMGNQQGALAAWMLATAKFDELVRLDPDDAQYAFELGNCYGNAAKQRIHGGEHDAAGILYEQAVAQFEELVRKFPDQPDYQLNLANMEYMTGLWHRDAGNYDVCETQLRKSLAHLETIDREFPAFDAHWQSLGLNYSNLGFLLADRNQWEEGEPLALKGLATLERLAERHPHSDQYKRLIPWCLNNLSLKYAALGNSKRAEVMSVRSIEKMKRLCADYPSVPEYQMELAVAYSNHGLFLSRLDDCESAENEFRRGTDAIEKLAGENPEILDYRYHVGRSWGMLCEMLVAKKRWPEAREACRSQLKAWDQVMSMLKDSEQLYEEREVEMPGAFASGSGLVAEMSDVYWTRALELQDRIDARRKATEDARLEHESALVYARARSGILSGQTARILQFVDETIAEKEWNATAWYNFACIYAVACENDKINQSKYADLALGYLQTAVKAGWSDREHILNDVDLLSIRDREQFQEIIALIPEDL